MINPKDYIDYLSQNKIYLFTEQLSTTAINDTVLNSNLNWEEINSIYESQKIVVVDNLLKEEYALRLQRFKLTCNYRDSIYYDGGYEAIDYSKNSFWFSLLTNVTDEIKNNARFANHLEFERAWSFIYEKNCSGVGVHADPAAVNCNLWVTPDESIISKRGHNGLDVWLIEHPADWEHKDYNGNEQLSLEYIKKHDINPVTVDYKFNRCTFFNSKYFHRTQPVTTKDGHINKRINYTFLYR